MVLVLGKINVCFLRLLPFSIEIENKYFRKKDFCSQNFLGKINRREYKIFYLVIIYVIDRFYKSWSRIKRSF